MNDGVETKKKNTEECICDALEEIKSLQDFIIHSKTKYFGKLLSKIAGIDTIPFVLFADDGPLRLSGHYRNHLTKKDESFVTPFFRIEEIDSETCCVTISLLLPLDLDGNISDSPCNLMILRRTEICSTLDSDCICGIQIVDSDFLKRKIIIEPKW